MESIDIDEPRETIIIEKLDGRTIAEGSHLYCGMCGHTLGLLARSLSFPFDSKVLVENMQMRTFLHGAKHKGANVHGIAHAMCNHTMFVNDKTWNFISLPEYISLKFKDKIMHR